MKVGTTRYITADSEKQALAIADALLRNRKFEDDAYESIRENATYSDFDNPQVLDYSDDWMPEYSDEEWQEIFGIDMKALREKE